MPAPQTRNSLILRLRRQDDVEAWEQFVTIYQPLIGDKIACIGNASALEMKTCVEEDGFAAAGKLPSKKDQRWIQF